MKVVAFLLLVALFVQVALAQACPSPLLEVNDRQLGLKVCRSTGVEQQKALQVGLQCTQAYGYLSVLLKFKPTVVLLVLDEQDWDTFSSSPIFGMPNYFDGKLVVSGGKNSLFDSLSDLIVQYLSPYIPLVEQVYPYSEVNGTLTFDLSPFSDLLVVHELAHSFHEQNTRLNNFTRNWLNEFFADYCLEGFVSTLQPKLAAPLHTFPYVFLHINASIFPYRTLQDLDTLYDQVGGDNYAWYQCNFHYGSHVVFNTTGQQGISTLYNAFLDKYDYLNGLTDDKFCDFLYQNTNTVLGDFCAKFPPAVVPL